MEITNFKDMYIAELQELRSVEGQLAAALSRMAETAANPSLKDALAHHCEQTQVQAQRLDAMLQKHGANPRAHTDQAMQALVAEADKMLAMVKMQDLRDAALIASAQKLEHYEIAAYGTAAVLAGQLELRDDQQLLHQTLMRKRPPMPCSPGSPSVRSIRTRSLSSRYRDGYTYPVEPSGFTGTLRSQWT